MLLIYCCFILFGILTGSAEAKVKVKIERHFPCSASLGPRRNRNLIKFPGSSNPGVRIQEIENANGQTCFMIGGGEVDVKSPGLLASRDYHIHLETKFGIESYPEPCINSDRNKCGGIGSCVHCNVCATAEKLSNYVQIYRRNEPVQCSRQNLNPGRYTDLSMKVCLPGKKDILPLLDRNTNRALKLWDSFVSSKQTRRGGGLPLVIFARLFDRPINLLSPSRLEDALRGNKQGMVGCHWFYASLYDL